MCFHGNQHPSSKKHPFIFLYSEYQSFMFTYFPDMNSPIFPRPILDDIYCRNVTLKWVELFCFNSAELRRTFTKGRTGGNAQIIRTLKTKVIQAPRLWTAEDTSNKADARQPGW